MKKLVFKGFLAASILFSSLSLQAQKGDIVDIAAGSPDHSTLVTAVKAADLVGTLKSKGPFTVFAPTNAAFAKLPAGTVNGLLKADQKTALTRILTYHVVAGNLDAKSVLAAIKEGKGQAVLTTVSGGKLIATLDMGKVKLTDEMGSSAYVTKADLKASNGVIHVIDTVLMPK